MDISDLYSKKVLDHFKNPRNMGEIKDADGVSTVGNPVCLPPNSLILANSKVFPIQNLQKKNKVLSHDGQYHKVIKTYKRNYYGKLYSLRVHSLGELTVTPEHHILALKMAHISHKFEAFQKKKALLDWFNASQLEKGDVILYPVPKEVYDRSFLKTKIEKPRWDFRSKDLPEEIPVNDDFLRLVGYYLAGGYLRTKVTQEALGFVFGSYEPQLIKDVVFLMKKIFGFSPSAIDKKRNSVNLIFYRAQLVQFFEGLFGRGALDKHLPHWMMVLSPEKQKALLRGLWRGDGHISKKKKTSKFVTISEQLAYQVRLLLLRQKIIASFLTLPAKGIHKKHYSIYVKEDGSLRKLAQIVGTKVNFPSKKQNPHKSWFDDDFYYVPIWKIKSFTYKGWVYNLEVENSASYVTNAATLHNCGDIMRMFIKIGYRTNNRGQKEEYIEDVKFQTLGCGAAIATSSIATEMIKGKSLKEALTITNKAVAEALGGLPPAKIHCSVLAEEAVKKAIEDYQRKKVK